MVAMVRRGEQAAYFASGVPVFIHRTDDAVGRRVAAVQMMELGLARQNELSAALHVNRTTLYRQAAQQVGVTEGTIRHAIRRGELRRRHAFNRLCPDRDAAEAALADTSSRDRASARASWMPGGLGC